MAGPEAPGTHRRAAPSPPMEGMEGEPGEAGRAPADTVTPYRLLGPSAPAGITACAEPLSAPPEPLLRLFPSRAALPSPGRLPLPSRAAFPSGAAFPSRAGPAPGGPGSLAPAPAQGPAPPHRGNLSGAAGVLAWPYGDPAGHSPPGGPASQPGGWRWQGQRGQWPLTPLASSGLRAFWLLGRTCWAWALVWEQSPLRCPPSPPRGCSAQCLQPRPICRADHSEVAVEEGWGLGTRAACSQDAFPWTLAPAESRCDGRAGAELSVLRTGLPAPPSLKNPLYSCPVGVGRLKAATSPCDSVALGEVGAEGTGVQASMGPVS